MPRRHWLLLTIFANFQEKQPTWNQLQRMLGSTWIQQRPSPCSYKCKFWQQEHTRGAEIEFTYLVGTISTSGEQTNLLMQSHHTQNNDQIFKFKREICPSVCIREIEWKWGVCQREHNLSCCKSNRMPSQCLQYTPTLLECWPLRKIKKRFSKINALLDSEI